MANKKDKQILFTTDSVDDSYFMSSDLHIRKGVHEQTLEFHIDGQRDNTKFTIYKQGIIDLQKFLTKWLDKNPS